MSLARTALRLAAVAALEVDPVIAALCQRRIFDSRIDELDAKEAVPLIVVYTEDDGGKAWSANNGGPPFDHACDLLLEISLRVTTPIADSDDVLIEMPVTDREAESTLDLLEECAIAAVTSADTPQARLVRTITRRTTEFKSIRFASADTGGKAAMRLITLTTHLKGDEPDLLDPPTGPFAALPDPLRTVALSLDPASSAYATCAALAAKLTVPSASALSGLDVTLHSVAQFDPATPPSATDPTAADPFSQQIDLAP